MIKKFKIRRFKAFQKKLKCFFNISDYINEQAKKDIRTMASDRQQSILNDEENVDNRDAPNIYPYKKCCDCGERKSCGHYVEDEWYCEDCHPEDTEFKCSECGCEMDEEEYWEGECEAEGECDGNCRVCDGRGICDGCWNTKH
jgi:hypothetical protein